MTFLIIIRTNFTTAAYKSQPDSMTFMLKQRQHLTNK